MRRTYKSKKDVGGGLDHKEMICNIDEKSSAFDAFYIQNIKQAKREQSCMGSSNYVGVRNKVRKRKYVKRIVKETELPARVSVSDSVFLTPDKSLRVNKAPDLFDQLLNSSPALSGPKQSTKQDLFSQLLADTPKETKVYKRRRAVIKKYNYSSSESSESSEDISNRYNSVSEQNSTDIRSHKLVIEKEATLSPKGDESIYNIVRKLSQLKQNQIKSCGDFKRTFKHNRNRLTMNLKSPLLKMSPLCSTPFTEKQRSRSIYKFSPIPLGDLEDSPNYVTVVEDGNESIKSFVFVPKNNSSTQKRSLNDDGFSTHYDGDGIDHKAKESSTPLFSSEADTQSSVNKDSVNEIEIKENESLNKDQKSILQTSEIQPFVGFDEMGTVDYPILEDHNESIIISTGKTSKGKQKSKEFVNFSSPETRNDNSLRQKDKETDTHTSTIEYSTYAEPFLGFTDQDKIDMNTSAESVIKEKPVLEISKVENVSENSDDECLEASSLSSKLDDSNNSSLNTDDDDRQTSYDTCSSTSITQECTVKEPIVKLERMNMSLFNKYYDKEIVSDPIWQEIVSNPTLLEDLVEPEKVQLPFPLYNIYSEQDSESGSSEETDEEQAELDRINMSLLRKYLVTDPDPACKETFRLQTQRIEEVQEPIVEIERMNMSVFNEYLKKTSDNYSECGEESNSNDDEDESFVTGNNLDVLSGDESTSTDIETASIEEEMSFKDTDSDYKETGQSTDEERCISFVTTRRRNDFTNDATILVLDDSVDSISSEDCNKTVLSQQISSHSPKQEMNSELGIENDKDKTMNSQNSNIEENLPQTACSSNADETELRMSLGTPRKSEVPGNLSPNTSMFPKAGIVLQPGKKWERSLSIYRRMSTMNDHFDQTLIEEDLHNKGRKYRQSVINTMEMQEGSLHNESIHSHRCTFVPKQSRSTIRIVKETSNSRISLSSTTTFDDLKGFLEDCDDTVIELSKLSIADDLDVTVLDKFHESKFHDPRIATARDYVLRRCNQLDTLPFDECYPDPALKNCRKIGEGVYGEVFLWRAPDGRARVMKVVPIAGDIRVNGEQQKDFHEVISEIVIAMELSALRAPIAEIECHLDEGKELDAIDLHSVENATDVFNEVLGVKCVYGAYPSRLLDLWELYDECRGSENDTPAVLPPHQQYMVLELANAGQDLESYCFNSAEQAHALFLQVAFALAVGEEAFQFEHRDLHWGNVLIAPTDQKYATFVLRGRCHRVLRRGVCASIIDYSLSRISLPLAGAGAADSAALYNDLSTDDGLFSAVGDYQFQLYRLMRDKLGNDWKNFEPFTNILWLHYTVDKMITALRYKRTNTKTHKQYINKLKAIRDRLLSYGSAVQFVLTDNEF